MAGQAIRLGSAAIEGRVCQPVGVGVLFSGHMFDLPARETTEKGTDLLVQGSESFILYFVSTQNLENGQL